MNQHVRHRRGFTMIIAIALLGLVGSALLLLTRQLAAEGRRTRATYDEAQLRMLLIAGADDAVEHSKSWNNAPAAENWQIALPQSLLDSAASVSLSSRSTDADTVEVMVIARFRNREAMQVLLFHHSEEAWKAAGVAPAMGSPGGN
jgi:hypothetical protein